MEDADQGWVSVAKASELLPMSIKHVAIGGREIAVVNWGGQYFAVGDRCGHMNAPLSRGKLATSQGKNLIVCPLHGSTFDVATGKNVTGPVKGPPPDPSKPVPEALAKAAELAALIKVYDQDVFEVRRDGDDIELRVTPRPL